MSLWIHLSVYSIMFPTCKTPWSAHSVLLSPVRAPVCESAALYGRFSGPYEGSCFIEGRVVLIRLWTVPSMRIINVLFSSQPSFCPHTPLCPSSLPSVFLPISPVWLLFSLVFSPPTRASLWLFLYIYELCELATCPGCTSPLTQWHLG